MLRAKSRIWFFARSPLQYSRTMRRSWSRDWRTVAACDWLLSPFSFSCCERRSCASAFSWACSSWRARSAFRCFSSACARRCFSLFSWACSSWRARSAVRRFSSAHAWRSRSASLSFACSAAPVARLANEGPAACAHPFVCAVARCSGAGGGAGAEGCSGWRALRSAAPTPDGLAPLLLALAVGWNLAASRPTTPINSSSSSS
mmetsp:Transcript_19341/g.42320  ORF Transcript_19341/g.42320 Transcript_19341/m.42320 type:complete len:203 (-) Transcript_19341:1168-1776(-)